MSGDKLKVDDFIEEIFNKGNVDFNRGFAFKDNPYCDRKEYLEWRSWNAGWFKGDLERAFGNN